MTTKHCFLSITIFLCDICMEVSNCVRNKRQVIHSFFDDRTIKGNRHVLPAMCVSFKTIVSYNIMSHKLVIFSKVYFLNRFWQQSLSLSVFYVNIFHISGTIYVYFRKIMQIECFFILYNTLLVMFCSLDKIIIRGHLQLQAINEVFWYWFI